MAEKIIRPFPIPRQAVLRSTLFALAKVGAQLHQYSEDNGTIIASVKSWGFNKEIKVSIHEYEQTSLLELTAPNPTELLNLISAYAIRGAKAIKDDAISQWNDLINQEQARRKREQTVSKLVSYLPGMSKTEVKNDTALLVVKQTVLATIGDRSKAVTCIHTGAIEIQMPNNPGMLMKNRHNDVFEIEIDPVVCQDRSSFVQFCKSCFTPVLQHSWHCSNCGNAITLEAAVKHELEVKTRKHANASLLYASLSLLPYVLAVAFLAAPILATGAVAPIAAITTAITTKITMLGFAIVSGALTVAMPPLFLIVLPSFLLGRKAISEAQKAAPLINLNFNEAKIGKKRVWLGQTIGGFAVYASVGFFLLLLIIALKSKGL